jgi:hypothetical protein
MFFFAGKRVVLHINREEVQNQRKFLERAAAIPPTFELLKPFRPEHENFLRSGKKEKGIQHSD